MAFSDKTRDELSRVIPKALCCRIAELSAYYDLDGFLMGTNGRYLDFNNTSPLVARKILTLLKGVFGDIPTQVLVQRSRSRRSQVCTVRVLSTKAAREVYLKLTKQKYRDQEHKLLRKKCCRRSYVRGAFLARGSITNPERTYHLEISTEKSEIASRVIATINSLDLDARLTQRKGSLVVYLKDGEQIVTLLNMIGAHNSLLQFENVRVMKGMRNQVNRLVNCETANVDKTVQAAMVQVEAIEEIARHMELTNLPPKLYQIAKLRLDNPYISLKELGDLAMPKMSKSGVNYRIKQLLDLRDKLQLR